MYILDFLAQYHIIAYILLGYFFILSIGFFYHPVKFILYNVRILIQKYVSLFFASVKIIDITKIDKFKTEARYIRKMIKP